MIDPVDNTLFPWWESLAPAAGAVKKILAQNPSSKLDAFLVLGSGMGDVIKRWTPLATWQPGELPGAPVSTVSGHAGAFHLLEVGGKRVLVQQGRVHLYEEGDLDNVLFMTRLAYRLGARWLLLTNAAGGIDPRLEAGMLVILEDQISLFMGRGFGWSPSRLTPPRTTYPIGSPFHPGWVKRLTLLARELKIPAQKGVLAGGLGPNYETAAEVNAWRQAGAHAATMSTVMEAFEGRGLGLLVGGISFISNMATGLSKADLTHEEVIALGRRAARSIGELLEKALIEGP